MKSQISAVRRVRPVLLALAAGLLLSLSPVAAQQPLVIKPVTEKKLKQLPAGPLYWRVETLPTLGQAQAAAGETSLAAEVSGKSWLFTLGPKGGATPGARKIAEIGPFRSSPRPNTCCASTTRAVRPGPKHPCIPILAQKPFTC